MTVTTTSTRPQKIHHPAVLRSGSTKQYEENTAGGQNPHVIHIQKSDGSSKHFNTR